MLSHEIEEILQQLKKKYFSTDTYTIHALVHTHLKYPIPPDPLINGPAKLIHCSYHPSSTMLNIKNVNSLRFLSPKWGVGHRRLSTSHQ